MFSCSPNLLIFLLRDLSLFNVFHFFDWQTHLDHQHCWFELEAHLHVGTAAIPTSALAQLWIRSNSWFNRWFRRSSSSNAMPGCQAQHSIDIVFKPGLLPLHMVPLAPKPHRADLKMGPVGPGKIAGPVLLHNKWATFHHSCRGYISTYGGY